MLILSSSILEGVPSKRSGMTGPPDPAGAITLLAWTGMRLLAAAAAFDTLVHQLALYFPGAAGNSFL